MTDTQSLIEHLAQRAGRVRPLASPMQRTLLWALVATALTAALTLGFGLRPRLVHALADGPQALQWAASILTGLLAAYAAFQISVPGRSPSWAWLPLLPMLLWLGGLGWGCAADIATLGPGWFVFQSNSAECMRMIAMMSVPMGLAMLLMVRHARVVRPGPTAMLAALSSAAMSSAGVSLVHSGETALMSLLWHFCAVLVLSLLCLLMGERLFAWIGGPRSA